MLKLCMIATLATLLLSSCALRSNVEGTASDERARANLANQERVMADSVTREQIEQVALDADKMLVDGWICGRDPRIFKSPYRTVPASAKADFALAYRDFIASTKQDLASSLKTYIPYKERSAFARKFWQSYDPQKKLFADTDEKYQVAWIHESLLDGSELMFRALEHKYGSALNSNLIMAHDVEQNMVSKYMADESTESSFAWQLKPKVRHE